MSECQATPEQLQKWREEFEDEFSRRFYEAKGYWPALIIGGEAFEWYSVARAIDAQRIAELEAQAKTADELLVRAYKSICDFVSDHGWADSDMDTMDSIGAFLAAAKRKGEL